MTNDYEEGRDRGLAGPDVPEFVLTRDPAIKVSKPKRDAGKCERETCKLRLKFWVQRGPIGIMVCGPHLSTAVTEMHEIKPGRYHADPELGYEGYWISATSVVVVKMKTEGGGWR